MVVPTPTKHWIITVDDLLSFQGIALNPGERAYLTGDVNALSDVFLAVASRNIQPLPKHYTIDSKQVYKVPLSQLRQYLENQGEVLPSPLDVSLRNVIDPITGLAKRVPNGTEVEREIVATGTTREEKV